MRIFFSCLFIVLAAMLLTTQASAGAHLRLRLPRINFGKAAEALAYPITKTVVNGVKTTLKVAEVADKLGVVPNIGPPAVSGVVKKALWGVGRH